MCDKPILKVPHQQNERVAFDAPRVEFVGDGSTWGLITNPRAVLEVLDPESFLRGGLSEAS
jgi:hypothetical protein